MAMYYYARRLQKSSSSAKKNKTTLVPRDPVIALNSNGSVPSVISAEAHKALSQEIGVGGCSANGGSNKASPSFNTLGVRSTSKSPPPVGSTSTTSLIIKSGTSKLPPNNNTPTLHCNLDKLSKSHTRNHLGTAVNHHLQSGNLVFEDGHLISGTLEGLVDSLIPTEDHYPDTAFLFAFILGSRIFIRPHQLLATVLHRAFLNKNEEESIAVVHNLVKLLGEWIHIFPYDFRDDNGLMMANVRTITTKCVHICPTMKDEVSILLTSLLEKLMILEKFETKLAKINAEMESNQGMWGKDGGSTTRLIQLCPDPHILAEQLTLVELERFSFIGAQEFIQAFLREPCSPQENLHLCSPLSSLTTMTSTISSSTSTDPTTPVTSVVNCNGNNGSTSSSSGNALGKSRLELYVEWFHRLSVSVATDICKTGRKKERVRTLEYWVQVGTNCVNLGNFNSAIAIYTGLNSNPVRRLIKTWSKFQERDKLRMLEQLCDSTNNYATYRTVLKSKENGSSVIIPFFSLLIKDLFFLKEATAARLPNGHLYFSNFLQLGRTVGEVMGWQQHKPSKKMEKVPHLFHWIQTMPPLTEDALMLASFECESPSTPQEKGEYQSLILKLQQTHDLLPNNNEEMTNSSQSSLPLPSTSSTGSGSTSGVHEEDECGTTGLSPTEIHNLLLRFNSSLQPMMMMNDILSNSTLKGLMGVVTTTSNEEVQVHVEPPGNNNGTSSSEENNGVITKPKPPVPL